MFLMSFKTADRSAAGESNVSQSMFTGSVPLKGDAFLDNMPSPIITENYCKYETVKYIIISRRNIFKKQKYESGK